MAIAFKSVSAALALSLASLSPAAEKNNIPDPRQEAIERQADRREQRKENQETLVTVKHALKQENPVKALEAILKKADDADTIEFLQRGLRANDRSDLLVVNQDTLAKIMKLDDPAQAKPALEKLLYRPEALIDAQKIRKLLDESLSGQADPEIFNKIRTSSRVFDREIPGLLTNGSLASKDGFLLDLKTVHDKLSEADQKSDLVKKSFAALAKDFDIKFEP